MQDFKFLSYVEFFDALSEEDKVMTSLLKDLVYEAIPDIKEKLSWNVPFFSKKKTICFIWPGSIPWGKKTYEGVTMGFNQGYRMQENDLFLQGDRKQITTKVFHTVDEIEANIDVILELLREANDLD